MDNIFRKEEEIKVTLQKLNILKWEKEFEECLKFNLQKDLELFPVDKLWFTKYKNEVLLDCIPIEKKIENYHSFEPLNNSNILHDMKSINPESDFIFLNKDCMDSFSPSVMKNKQFNIKIIGRFLNGKMISRIGKDLYYLFFTENNLIREGLLIFGNYDINLINQIINDFLHSDINIFKNKFFNANFSQNNKFIIYHRNEFDFLIKTNKNGNMIKSNLKIISIPKSNGNMKYGIENIKPRRNIKLIKENGLNKYLTNEFLSLTPCIYEYFYSEKEINNFINDKSQNYKIFQIISKPFLDEFKKAIFYDKIKQLLSKEEKSTYFKKIISDFINNNNLNEISFGDFPLTKKEIDIKNKKRYFYYNDYQLLTKNSFSEFNKFFNNQNNNKGYNSYLLNKNYIFVQYNDICGEIIGYNEFDLEHKYFIISKKNLKEIIKCLQRNGVKKGLSFYGFKDSKEYELEDDIKLIDGNKVIGILKMLEIPQISEKKNKKNICSDDEIIDNDDKVFEDDNKRSKIIKRKRFLGKNNGKTEKIEEDEEVEEKLSKKITNINMKNKKSFKKFSKQKINYDDDEEEKEDDLGDHNNVNESIKNLRSSKMEKKFIEKESEEYSLKPIKTSDKKLKIKSPKSSKKLKNIYNSPSKKVNINSKKQFSEKESNQILKSKVKSKIKINDMKTPPQYNKTTTSKFKPHKKKNKIENSFLSPKQSFKKRISKYEKDEELNPIKNNNRPFLSPQNSSKRLKKKILDSPSDDNIDIGDSYNKNVPGLIGLQNIGATCYMNATLQCFSNVPRFREGILNLKNKQSNNKNLSYSLNEVFKNLWQNNKIKYYEPYNFKQLISLMNPLFKGVAANDSKDLILFILETIHNELNIKKHLAPVQYQVDLFLL